MKYFPECRSMSRTFGKIMKSNAQVKFRLKSTKGEEKLWDTQNIKHGKSSGIRYSHISMSSVLHMLAGCNLVSTNVPSDPPLIVEEGTQTNLDEETLSPVTGLPIVSEGSPVAVSIGNNPSARLQSGLTQADLVYEVLAEGGITRFLAVFHNESPDMVGPVRSARPYLVLLAKEWGAVFGHCGGDPKDLEPLKDWDVVDADELFGRGDLFGGRIRGHHPTTYIPALNICERQRRLLPRQNKGTNLDWDDEPRDQLRIEYGYGYTVEYHYSAEDQGYHRFMIDNGTRMQQKDLNTQEAIAASNIIVQFANTKVVYSDGGLVIDLIGEEKH